MSTNEVEVQLKDSESVITACSKCDGGLSGRGEIHRLEKVDGKLTCPNCKHDWSAWAD